MEHKEEHVGIGVLQSALVYPLNHVNRMAVCVYRLISNKNCKENILWAWPKCFIVECRRRNSKSEMETQEGRTLHSGRVSGFSSK